MVTVGCSHIQARSAASASPSLSTIETSRIRELYRVWAIAGDQGWPGFNQSNFNLSFILIDQNSQWAVNVEPLPAEYVAVEIPQTLLPMIKGLAETQPYRNERGEKELNTPKEIHRSFPPEYTNFHFKHSIYFVTSIEGFQTEGQTITADDWIHISLHELFHNYQDRFVQYSPEFTKAISFPYWQQLREDHQFNGYVSSELKLLAQAACGNQKEQIRQDLKAALRIRNERWDYIEKRFGSSPKAWERYQVWAEGTAHYVEHKIMSHWPVYSTSSELSSDPYFKNYEAYKSESLTTWCKDIASYSHTYWYDVGFAYALILDKLEPTWKVKLPSSSLFFDAYFKSLH